MPFLIALNILNLVGAHLNLNSDRSEFQKDNYRSNEIANVKRYTYKDTDGIETPDENAIPYSGQYENDNIVQNVKTGINSIYTDTGQTKDNINEDKDFDRDIKTNLKQNINVKYNTDADWYDITTLNPFNKDTISNVNPHKNVKVIVNSVQIFRDLPEITVNKLDVDHNSIEDLEYGKTQVRTILNIEQIEPLVFNQYIEYISNLTNQNINTIFNHYKHIDGTSVNQNMDVDQNVTELFNQALISNPTNLGQKIKIYSEEDITDDVNKVTNSHDENWDTNETEDESKSYKKQDSILNDTSDCDENCTHKNNLDKTDTKNEVKELSLDEIKHAFVAEEQKFRPIKPKVHFTEEDNAKIYMNIRWGPLVRQEKRVNKSHKRKGGRKPTPWERYYTNYHENIGIPAATKIHSHEAPKVRLWRRSSTRIVNGIGADVGQFPYLVRFIR